MKHIFRYSFTILFACVVSLSGAQDCTKCDISPLSRLSDNMENLDIKIIKSFLCTLDSSCIDNAEYSEWSNGMIFKLIRKDVDLFNKALHELGYNYVLLVANELESPIMDFDLKPIYLKINQAWGPKDMIEKEKEAIRVAAKNEGIKLE